MHIVLYVAILFNAFVMFSQTKFKAVGYQKEKSLALWQRTILSNLPFIYRISFSGRGDFF